MDTIAVVEEIWSSDRKTRFLISLLREVGIAARGGYVAAGNTPEIAAERFYGYNEMCIVISDELGKVLGYGSGSRNAEDFVAALQDWARFAEYERGLERAIKKSAQA